MRHIYFLISVFSFLFLNPCLKAETAEEAFAREKNYLTAQKNSLLNLKRNMKSSLESRKNQANFEIKKIQTELSEIILQNQSLLEEYKSIEKITKDSGQITTQLDKNSLKIAEIVSELSPKLGFEYKEPLSNDPVTKFEANLNTALNLIENLSKSEWRNHAFLNEKEQLVKGEIYFIGLHSAWGKVNNQISSLAPYNKDFLKVVPNTNDGSIFIFPSDFQKVPILSAKTWKESIADSIPGIVMLLIMLAVFGLFFMLAKA